MTMSQTMRQPIKAALERRTAMQLAEAEYGRCLDLLRSLRPEDWTKPTNCPPWKVRQMAAHLLGMVEMAASIRDQGRQNRAAKASQQRDGGLFIDALTRLQVDERADMTPRQIIDRFAARAPKAVKGRRRAPGFVRHRQMPELADVGGRQEAWTFGYLIDTILTRDPWMHRIDLVDSTGATHVLTADHDGVLVADVVNEWAQRHGQPFSLRLTGPAGGSWTRGTGGPEIEMDAIDFARAVSGRAPADGLLTTQVPF